MPPAPRVQTPHPAMPPTSDEPFRRVASRAPDSDDLISEMFDVISYSKGASSLRMLQAYVDTSSATANGQT